MVEVAGGIRHQIGIHGFRLHQSCQLCQPPPTGAGSALPAASPHTGILLRPEEGSTSVGFRVTDCPWRMPRARGWTDTCVLSTAARSRDDHSAARENLPT